MNHPLISLNNYQHIQFNIGFHSKQNLLVISFRRTSLSTPITVPTPIHLTILLHGPVSILNSRHDTLY